MEAEFEKRMLYELFRKYKIDENLSELLANTLAENGYSTKRLDLICKIKRSELREMGIEKNAFLKEFIITSEKIARDNSIEFGASDESCFFVEELCSRMNELNKKMIETQKSIEIAKSIADEVSAGWKVIAQQNSLLAQMEEAKKWDTLVVVPRKRQDNDCDPAEEILDNEETEVKKMKF